MHKPEIKIVNGDGEGNLLQFPVPMRNQAVLLAANIQLNLADALRSGDPVAAMDPYTYLDKWLQHSSRGRQLSPTAHSLENDCDLSTEKWTVHIDDLEPHVLLRFMYVTADMKEGYGYFVQPLNAPVENAVSYQSQGYGPKRTWNQTDLTTDIDPETYRQILLNSHLRTLNIAAYLINFPSPGGEGLDLPDESQELLAA